MSLVWTVVSSGSALAVGIARSSLALVAFGAVGLLDAVGSAALSLHFRHALHHEALSLARERLALRIVTIGLLGVSLSTGIESTRRLFQQAHPGSSTEGIILAATSMVGLGALAVRKRTIARAVPSQALLADSVVSATGALLALVTLGGTWVNGAYGWRWADPGAALAVAVGAIVIAYFLRQEAHDEPLASGGPDEPGAPL